MWSHTTLENPAVHSVIVSAADHYRSLSSTKLYFYTNDPKVFKLGVGNDLGISWILQVVYVFRLKGQRSRLELGLTAIRRGFELYECLLVCY